MLKNRIFVLTGCLMVMCVGMVLSSVGSTDNSRANKIHVEGQNEVLTNGSKIVDKSINSNDNIKHKHLPKVNGNSTTNVRQVNGTVSKDANDAGGFGGLMKNKKLKISPCDKSIKNIAVINDIDISNCKSSVCQFKRGEKSSIKVDFTTRQRITSLDLNITGIINNKGIPFNVNYKNHCLETVQEMKTANATKCLLERNQKYHYEYSMDVSKTYPPVSVFVSIQTKFGDKSVFCFIFQARLV